MVDILSLKTLSIYLVVHQPACTQSIPHSAIRHFFNQTKIKAKFSCWTLRVILYLLDLLKHIAKLSQAKPQLQLSWLALASLNFT